MHQNNDHTLVSPPFSLPDPVTSSAGIPNSSGLAFQPGPLPPVTAACRFWSSYPPFFPLLPTSGARSINLLPLKALPGCPHPVDCTGCPSVWPTSPHSSPFVYQPDSQAKPGGAFTFRPPGLPSAASFCTASYIVFLLDLQTLQAGMT